MEAEEGEGAGLTDGLDCLGLGLGLGVRRVNELVVRLFSFLTNKQGLKEVVNTN
jgi:hypothetical protein